MATEPALQELQQTLVYHFHQPALLRQALTHRSAGTPHNQRLEFLGDAALGLIMADLLAQDWPEASEGQLSQLRSVLVNQETLAGLARQLALHELLVVGLGERKSGGHERDSTLSDALEAVIGAIYLDGGFEPCRNCVKRLFSSHLVQIVHANAKDAKTRLQEWMQARGLTLPHYKVVAISGEEHDQVFHVECRIVPLSQPTTGAGRSRKLAEQEAAAAALDLLDVSARPSASRGEK